MYATSLALIIALILYTVFHKPSRRSAESGLSSSIPAFVTQAPELSGTPSDTFAHAAQLLQNGDLASSLPLLGSVIKHGGNNELESKAALLAATALAARSDQTRNAIDAFTYALAAFPNQSIVPSARYQLALLYLGQGDFSKGQSLLTKLLRDTPESPFSVSAAFLAAQSAEIMEENDATSNHRLGNLLANLLPQQSGAIGGLVVTILMTLISTYLSHKEKIAKGNVSTITLVLALTVLTLYNAVTNFTAQNRQAAALVATATSLGK